MLQGYYVAQALSTAKYFKLIHYRIVESIEIVNSASIQKEGVHPPSPI